MYRRLTQALQLTQTTDGYNVFKAKSYTESEKINTKGLIQLSIIMTATQFELPPGARSEAEVLQDTDALPKRLLES